MLIRKHKREQMLREGRRRLREERKKREKQTSGRLESTMVDMAVRYF